VRLRSLVKTAVVTILFAASLLDAQTTLRKIGELRLPVQSISATVQPANPTIPKNTAAGVRIVVSTASGPLNSTDVAQFLGGAFEVHGELSGPGLVGTITLPFVDPNGGATPIVDPLLLPIPALSEAGDYTLSNLRITVNGSPAIDVTPSTVPVKVIDQVLITSVTTRPLTLDEIKAAGIILDGSDFLGFQFTIGLATQSNATTISFPVVFGPNGVPIPQPILPPGPPARDSVPIPTIVPVLLSLTDLQGNVVSSNDIKFPGGGSGPVRIPSVLVIPGDVGFLKQFFSAQLYVSNGAPGGSGLTVHDLTSTINLPPGDDAVGGTADDPLSLPNTKDGPEPPTKNVMGAGPDGKSGTADDVNNLNPGDQAQAEFIIRGEKEGFHQISFDIHGILDGLATGPVKITGNAQGGVLVRNPFFDLTFAVPGVVRSGEQFKVYVTVKNISQSIANSVQLTLDASRMSGATLLSDQTLTIDTIAGGDAKTLTYTFKSLRTGQVVASYLHFDTTDGSTGELKFTLGVGERGIPLSPDTLVLPASVANLPQSVVDAAMLVLGEGWSIANAPAGALPPNVIRTSKSVVTKKALALAEAGLRVGLGQNVSDAVRDLLSDFYGGTPIDPGFDQLLRTTQAGQDFERAVGAALAQPVSDAGGPLSYQTQLSQVYASGPNFISFTVASGGAAPPVQFKLTDAFGNIARTWVPGSFNDTIPGFAQVPLGRTDNSSILALWSSPTSSTYTLQLAGSATGTVDLAVTMPHGDGSVIRGEISGAPVAPGSQARIVLDQTQPDRLVLEQDTNHDGSFATQQLLTTTIIAPQGPQFISAVVIGPETLPGASPMGLQMAMLFDRIVDSASAQRISNYQVPLNAVKQAKAQLSGRIVLANLQAPEGPYVPTTVSVSGVADQRGITGPAKTVSLDSRLQDIGAVVSGRVFNADGTPVGTAVINYSGLPPEPNNDCQAAQEQGPVGFANIPVNSDGRYEIRYVWQNPCSGFTVATKDPNTGSLRSLTNSVHTAGERLIMDIALFGRGSVAGTVRDLTGAVVPGATVVVLSQTDLQIGAQTKTDANGQYSVSGITVGPVSVQAGKGISVGRAAGDVPRAGNTAVIDVTLDSGSLNISGILRKVEKGVTAVVPNWPVVYSILDHPALGPTPVAVVNTDGNGNFTFTGVPAGNFVISAQLTAIDRGSISGLSTANQNLINQNLTIAITDQAALGTANGQVTFPDGSPAGGVVVFVGNSGVLANADGTYSLPGLPVQPGSQTVNAETRDGLRFGHASVLITQSGQVVNNINIVLSGLGTAQFTVLDSSGKLVQNQNVALLGCNFACGCDPKATAADGSVKFTNLPIGQVSAVAISNSFDVATANTSITSDGTIGFGVLRFAGTGTVTGNVLDAGGKPAFGADIVLSSNVFDQDSCSLVQGVSQHVLTDQSGNFKFTNVKVGRVSVTASQVFFPTQVGAQGVLAGAGQNVNFNLKLVNTISGVFSGNVLLPDGVTPAGAGVEVTANGPLPDVTVSTDANSHFAFAKIFPEGTYTVTVRDPISGGVTQEKIFLRAGQDMAHDFRLKGRGTVSVKVVDGSNLPVDSAYVRLTENDFPNSVQEDAVQPANQGTVTFQQVFEGPFSVEVSDIFGRGGRTSSVLPGDGSTVTVVVQLTSTGTVQGHFLQPDKTTPIPFSIVRLFASERLVGQITTDGSTDPGNFNFSFVPAGPVRLEAQDPVTARVGVAAGTIDHDGELLQLDVIAEGLGTATGLVTSNGSPEPGATVDIFSGNYHAITVADSTGHYLISGVPEGHIVANASLQNGFLAGTNSGSLVGDGTQLNLDVALRGSGTLTGQVFQADGATPAPASLVTVQVGGPGGGTLSVTTDADGNFSFPLVPAGTASVTVTVLGSIDRAQTSVEVLSADTVATTIRLNGIGEISGRTLDSAGNPVAGHVIISGTGAFPYNFALDTNSDGSFFMPQVLAGTFTANLRVQNGTITLFGSTSSSVAPGQTADITVQVQPSGSVVGTVLRSDGVTPAAGANVALALDRGGSVVVQAQTDGAFTANGLPLGGFTARVNDPVTTGQALLQGQSIASNGQILDLGSIVLNDTPMALVSIDPADGSTGVPVTQNIKIAFTDPLQSLTGISFTSNGHSIGFAGTLSTDGKLATFTGLLPDSAQIVVTVSTSVSDIFGRHPTQPTTATFQTVDLTPPSVASVLPAGGTTQVPGNTTIAVNFSEALSASASLTNVIAVTGPGGDVAGNAVLNTPTQVVFTPAATLPANGSFNVVVNHATDLSGNVQTSAYNFTFFTVDTIAPVVQLLQPPSGGFTTSARPSISFSATDALTGVNVSTAAITLDGQQVATGTLSFTPAANLTDGPHTVSATVADRAGNVGSGSGSFTIDTQPPSPAAISGISEGQVLKGTVQVSLSATDATSGVATIDLLVDGNVLAHTVPPFQFSLNSAAMADGNHTLTARATDVAGNIGAQGTAVHMVIDNVPLSVSFTSPAQGASFNNQFTTTSATNKATQRVDFTFAGKVISSTSSPFTATFSVATVQEGSQTITAQAFDFAGNSATATRAIVVDRTPPAAPNTSLINAEPPVGGFSQVHGLVGSVEAFATLQITNTTHPASATATVNNDGTFSTNIAGSVDDTLSLVAVDGAGNRSPAVLITVRTTSSLPPTTGNTALNYAGDLTDRVGTAAAALTPDGSLDAVFTLSLNVGSGVTRTLSRIDISNGSTTHSAAAGAVPIGVSSDITSPFLNRADGSISFSITSGTSLTLITPDKGFIQPGLTYTATAFFTDGSTFTGTFFVVPLEDRQLVAHSATITANPPTVQVPLTTPGASVITISNIRDIDGTLVPDGAQIAISVADMASKDPTGNLFRSAGGAIVDGVPAANNPNFKVFTIVGGTVTATYSSTPVTPPGLTGSLAIIQMQAADASGNLLGNEAVATFDLNVHAATDQAIVLPDKASLYGDSADRRIHFRVLLKDQNGNPALNGTKVLVSAVSCAAVFSSGFCVPSAGGQIIGGADSPSGSIYRVLTTTDGFAGADYSSSGLSMGVGQVVFGNIQVMASTSSGVLASRTLIGMAGIAVVGAGSSELTISPNNLPFVFPSQTAQVIVHHVHDERANLIPDGANFAVSASSCAAVFSSGFCVGSAGGSITDGLSSPSGSIYRIYPLLSGEFGATYSPQGASAPSPTSTQTSTIQLMAANPSGVLLDRREIVIGSLTLLAPENAIGTAQPTTILGDGGIHTSTVTFRPVLDVFGDPIPDGSKVVVSAASCAAVFASGFCVGSTGGQILNGTPSPSGSIYTVLTVQNGSVTVNYSDQNVIVGPGQTVTANIVLMEADANGSFLSRTQVGIIPVTITGLTSAQGTASPTVVHADGGDHRSTITLSSFRDVAGLPVPDGTMIGVSVANCTAVFPSGFCVSSAGGSIIGGTIAAFNSTVNLFPVTNGQVVFQYSSSPVVISAGQQTATIQVLAVTPGGSLISRTELGTVSVQLLAPGSATVSVSPADLAANGFTNLSQITVSGLLDSDGVTPVPDGVKVGLSANNCAAVFPSGFCVGSIGGQLLSGGVTPGDGTPAPNNGNFLIFTIGGNAVHAGYTDQGIIAGVNQTQVANVAVVAADVNSNALTRTEIGVGTINLHGTTSTTASGPASLHLGQTATVTFSNIKDSAGNLVPNGTLVAVASLNCATFFPSGFCVPSTGGSIVDGTVSPVNGNFRAYSVVNGSITVSYSSTGASLGTANLQIVPADQNGNPINRTIMIGGTWAISITN
jgi:hypothetical protein